MSVNTLSIRPAFREQLLASMDSREMFNANDKTRDMFLTQLIDPTSYVSGPFEWSVGVGASLSLHETESRVNSATFTIIPQSRSSQKAI